jgi:tetratricopeptide (TPR) repeat protein
MPTNQIGQADRAMDDFNAAIKLDPTYIDALNNRGLAYLGRGAYDLAIKDFDQVLKLDPNDADAGRNRAAALAKKSDQ